MTQEVDRKMRQKFMITSFLALLLVSLNFTNCRSPNLPQSLHIKIGGHTSQFGTPIKIAEAKGFYAKQGLTPSIRLVDSSKESMAALVGGDLDVIIATFAAGSFNAIRQGDLVVIADGGRAIPNVIIRKDLWENRSIKRLADLKGRSIMTPREGSASYYGLARILQGINLTIGDVKPKALSETAALAALEGKQIDAAILAEPEATNAVEKGLGVRYDVSEVSKFFPPNGEQFMGIFTLRKTLTEKPELLLKFLTAYLEGVQFYDRARNSNQPERSETIQIISQFSHADPAVLDKAIWVYVPLDGRPDIGLIKEMQDYFIQQKLIDSPVDLNGMIHLELLAEKK